MDADAGPWNRAALKRTREMQSPHFRELKNKKIEVGVRMWYAAGRVQGRCTGTERTHQHWPTCGGNYKLTPETMGSQSTTLPLLRVRAQWRKIYQFIRSGKKVRQIKAFLDQGRFLHADCHQELESKGVTVL